MLWLLGHPGSNKLLEMYPEVLFIRIHDYTLWVVIFYIFIANRKKNTVSKITVALAIFILKSLMGSEKD